MAKPEPPRETVSLASAILMRVDSWLRRQPEPHPSRSKAIEKLIEIGLAADLEAERDTPASREIERMAKARALRMSKAISAGDFSLLAAISAGGEPSKDQAASPLASPGRRRPTLRDPQNQVERARAREDYERARNDAKNRAVVGAPSQTPDATKTDKRAANAARAKELAIGALKEHFAGSDLPIEEKKERARKLIAPGKAKTDKRNS